MLWSWGRQATIMDLSKNVPKTSFILQITKKIIYTVPENVKWKQLNSLFNLYFACALMLNLFSSFVEMIKSFSLHNKQQPLFNNDRPRLYDWISFRCIELTCSVAVGLCRYLPWGSVVTIDTWSFSPAVDFIGFFPWSPSWECFTFTPVGISLSTSSPSLSHTVSLSFLLRRRAWPLSSSENGCSLVVFCHWTCAHKHGLNVRN